MTEFLKAVVSFFRITEQSHRTSGQVFFTCLFTVLMSAACTAGASGNGTGALKPYYLNLKADNYRPVKLTLKGYSSLSRGDNGQWTYKIKASSALVSSREQSSFLWQDQRAVPVHYQARSKLGFMTEKKSFDFNQKTGTLDILIDGKSKQIRHDGQLYDPMSYQATISQHFSNHKDPVDIRVVRYKHPFTHRFEFIEDTLTETGSGKLRTRKISQVINGEKENIRYIWLARDYGNIPVKYEEYSNNKLSGIISLVSGQYDGMEIKGLN